MDMADESSTIAEALLTLEGMLMLAGEALIGLLLNAMTIMDISYTVQNLIKSAVLLLALIVDALLNPRDEQTAQQGDI